MDITNGHAARMRYARYKNQVEGVQPRPREPRSANSSQKNSRGRPSAKKQKVEQGKKEEDDVKKEAGAEDKAEKRKIKRERGEGEEGGMPQAKMGGTLGPGAGIKREWDDVDAEGEVDETAENHMDLMRNASTSEKSPSRKGSKAETAMAVRIKREPVEGESGSPRRSSATVNAEGDAPLESINPSNLSASGSITTQPLSANTSATKASVSPQTSPHTISPPQGQAISPILTFNATTIPSMQHLQLNQAPPSQRLFSNDMTMQQTHTPPPPPPSHLSSNGGQGFTYPVPSYHTYAGQSPATTSSAPYSLPPSPVGGGGYQGDMNGYNMNGGGYDLNHGMSNGMNSGMMMNQGSFVGMLQDPSFPNAYGGADGGYGGVGGWENMYQ